MKHLILLVALFIGSTSIAQGMGDVTIYSNTGDKFYVVLNGIRQNDAPETNVKVTGLTNPWYSAKIISANNNFELEKNIPVKFDTLVTYRIVEKKGKYKLRYYSETSLGTATSVPNQSVVNYHSTENPTNLGNGNAGSVSTTTNVDENTTITGGGTGMTTTSTTTTVSTSENVGTGTTINSGNGTETIDINVNINEMGMGTNIDMNVSGTGIPTENVTTTTSGGNTSTTTTSSSSTSGTGNGTTYYEETTTTTTSSTTNNGTTTYYEETTTTTSGTGGNFGTTTTTTGNGNNFGTTTTTTGHDHSGHDHSGHDHTYNNCFTSDAEVDGIATMVENEAFSDDQSRIANDAAKNNCMTSEQIKRISEKFSFSDGQVNFLKLAYDNCTDKSNYNVAIESLTFSSDQDKVKKYISQR